MNAVGFSHCDVVNEVPGILTGDVGGAARSDSGWLAAFGPVESLASVT
jgi:hypothetical protein